MENESKATQSELCVKCMAFYGRKDNLNMCSKCYK